MPTYGGSVPMLFCWSMILDGGLSHFNTHPTAENSHRTEKTGTSSPQNPAVIDFMSRQSVQLSGFFLCADNQKVTGLNPVLCRTVTSPLGLWAWLLPPLHAPWVLEKWLKGERDGVCEISIPMYLSI